LAFRPTIILLLSTCRETSFDDAVSRAVWSSHRRSGAIRFRQNTGCTRLHRSCSRLVTLTRWSRRAGAQRSSTESTGRKVFVRHAVGTSPARVRRSPTGAAPAEAPRCQLSLPIPSFPRRDRQPKLVPDGGPAAGRAPSGAVPVVVRAHQPSRRAPCCCGKGRRDTAPPALKEHG
jgi:hypothetical protein